MAKRVVVFSLQGLGNAILNTRLLRTVFSECSGTLVVSDLVQQNYFQSLSWEINCFTLKDFFRQGWGFFDEAYALSPSWKRENLALFFTFANKKAIAHIEASRRERLHFFFFLNRPSFITTDLVHDFDVNCMLFGKSPQAIPFLSSKDFPPPPEKYLERLGKFISVHATSSSELKRVPAPVLAGFLEKLFLTEQVDHIALFGIPSERHINNEILSNFSRSFREKILIVDELSITQVGSLLSHAKFHFGLDSSLGHLAACFNVPVFTIWSFANMHRIHPFCENSHVFFHANIPQMSYFSDYPKENSAIRDSLNSITSDMLYTAYKRSKKEGRYIKLGTIRS